MAIGSNVVLSRAVISLREKQTLIVLDITDVEVIKSS